MRIAVLGATGSIGSAIAEEARTRGHEVRALVRDPARLGDDLAADAVACDATDASAIADASRDCDVLMSAIGGATRDGTPVVVEAAPVLLDVSRETGARLFVVGGAGSLTHPQGGLMLEQPGFPDAWRPASEAQVEALTIYREAGDSADWTYLSPADVIEPGERTGAYRTGVDEIVMDDAGESRISIADYAVAALDELERPQHRGRRFAVGY